MIRRRHLLAILAAAAALLGVAASPATASSSLPFKVTVSGSATWTSPSTVAFTGRGTALLMGTVTNQGSIQITGYDGSCPAGLANINTEVLTASNGDTLTLTGHDVSCPTGPGTFQGSGEWRVTGGTGRFHGATGGGTGVGSGDLNVGRITNTFTGMVTLAK